MAETKTTPTSEESVYSNFDSSHESLSTDDSLFITYDEETEESERKIQATQVVDCVVIAIWGITKEGKKFISLIHKSKPTPVKKLVSEFEQSLDGSKLSYVVLPGPESKTSTVIKAREECREIFLTEETRSGLTIKKHDRPYESSSVVISATNSGEVKILTVCPNPDAITEKMSVVPSQPILTSRDSQ